MWPYGWHYFAIDLGPRPGGWFDVILQRQGHKGDPDVFISEGRAGLPSNQPGGYARACACPTLVGLCPCSDTTCDACEDSPFNAEHQVRSNRTGMKGVFVVGVTGYCCEASGYSLKLEVSRWSARMAVAIAFAATRLATSSSWGLSFPRVSVRLFRSCCVLISGLDGRAGVLLACLPLSF